MQTVGVAIIARNSEKTIKSCVESFIKDVDQCVVVLAGESTDKTPHILLKLQKKYKNLEVYDFNWVDNFADARNFSFSKLKTDWLLWVDSDDTVINAKNLHKLANHAEEEVGAVWFPYHYAHDEFGNVSTLYERERLLRAKFGWLWKGRLHETVSPVNSCKFVRSDEVIIKHDHLAGATRHERNFKLLNIMLKENPNDKRVWLYMGHQHFATRDWMESAKWYLKFGTDKECIPIERYQALCYCSKAMREMKETQAVDVALMAIELFPNYRDAYLELAHSYLMIGDMDKALHWVAISDLKDIIIEPPHVIFINSLEYTFNKYCLLSECYLRKGEFAKALQYSMEAYGVRPIEDAKRNIEYIKRLDTQERVSDSVKILSVELLKNQEIVKLNDLLKATPYWFRDTPDYQMLRVGIEHYTQNIKDSPQIVGDGKNVLVNIGGSVAPKELLEKLDEKYDRVTVVAPRPKNETTQINVLSQTDMEELIMSKENRHIINLKSEPSRIICEYDKADLKGLKIRMFLGQGLEYWNPRTIKENGCGGSETSAAWLCREFAKRDCQPILYAMDNQVWDGVVYRNQFNPSSAPCHLFISSRMPEIFNEEIPSKQKWLWFHDVHRGNSFTPEIADKIDFLVVLSKWHSNFIKKTYPFLKDAEVIDLDNNPLTYDDCEDQGIFYPNGKCNNPPKIAIIGDAMDTDRFKELTDKRIPNRFIYCSSPDRGLEELLNLWSFIKKELPDAELKIFYGWNYFDSRLGMPSYRAYKENIRQLIKQDGVEWCGRVGQEQLAKELMRSSAMVYPPHPFRETYGIAFLEAQAAGVICFYRKNGALGETIGSRGIGLEMNAKPEEMACIIASTLTNGGECGIIRESARSYALDRDWGKQAEKFLKLYEEIDGSS